MHPGQFEAAKNAKQHENSSEKEAKKNKTVQFPNGKKFK